MWINYSDKTKADLYVPGVNAQWLEGHTLEEILHYANERFHPNQETLDALNDLNGKLTYKGSVVGESDIIDLTNVTTDILPAKTQFYNIGSPEKRFKSIYVDEAYLSTNTLYIGDIPVIGTDADTIVVKADPDQSLLMKTLGLGDTKICSDNNVEMISRGIGGNISIRSEGLSSKINLTSLSQINLEAPNINLVGQVAFDSASINNLIVKGGLTVEGTTTTINSTNLTVADNIIEINKGELGRGVSLGEAGLKINRGDEDAYYVLFDETDDSLKAGTRSSLKAIAYQDWVAEQLVGKSGDMSKSIYDTNNNGIVDKAEALHGCNLTPIQINDFYDEFKGLLNKAETEKFPKIDALEIQVGALETKAHSHTNTIVLDKLSASTDGQLMYDGLIINSSKENGPSVDIDLSSYMEKLVFESEFNPGSVKSADVATHLKDVELAQPLSYYGKNKEGEVGFHYFPVTNNDGASGTGLEQRVILDAKINQNYIIDSKNDLSECMTIVQAYKFIQGEQDIIKTVKTFNNGEKANFYYDENNILFNEASCTIKNEFDVVVTLNETLYETNLINKTEFVKMRLNKKEGV